jgi:hypothetical protein
MTRVTIVPLPTAAGTFAYQAVAGTKRSTGATAGEALDKLTALLPEEETSTLVILQSFRADRYFDVAKQRRLEELMSRWRSLRDVGGSLASSEQHELDALIDEEVMASAKRTAALLQELGQ